MGRKGDKVDGVMLFDKPLHLSSNAALQKVRRMLNAQKAGHTGTLDPMASGLLPLCFGEATKFSADLLDAEKTYEARVKLGVKTTTGDVEGEVVSERSVDVDEAAIVAAAARFIGEIEQIPPMYSALKKDGRCLYELAREGVEVERKPRRVTIKSLEVFDFDGVEFTMRTTVSKGTYIRTLAEDIGEALGCGAHLTSLRRTKVGHLSIEDARTLQELENLETTEEVRAKLSGADSLLTTLPKVVLNKGDAARFLHGQRLASQVSERGRARIYSDEGVLLGTARIDERAVIRPERLIAMDN